MKNIYKVSQSEAGHGCDLDLQPVLGRGAAAILIVDRVHGLVIVEDVAVGE